MSSLVLDTSKFAANRLVGAGRNAVSLNRLVMEYRPSVEKMQAARQIRKNPSFGFAMANPDLNLEGLRRIWDNPYKLGWFLAGWGDEPVRYSLNGLRKMRPAARELRNSLDLQQNYSWFRDVVASQEEDGSFLWGDFPWGGAVILKTEDGRVLLGSVSGLTQYEDAAFALLILSRIAQELPPLPAY